MSLPSRQEPGPANSSLARAVTALERWIHDGGYLAGERIGSERELAASLGMPRSRLRSAVDVLEEQHVLRRATGRTGGVFADDGRLQRRLNTVESVPSLLRQQGRHVDTLVLHQGMELPDPYERRQLGLGEDTNIVTVRRLRRVDGDSWSIESSSFPAVRFAELLRQDLTGSLYEIIHRLTGVSAATAKETLVLSQADEQQAETLGVANGSALMEIHRTSYDQNGQPFEVAHDFFRGDRTRVHTRRYGANWKRTIGPRTTPGHDATSAEATR